MMQFQSAHNAVLETAIRHNSIILDSDFFAGYLSLTEKTEDVDVFLASAEATSEPKKDDGDQGAFFMQFLAAQVFFQSTALPWDNEIVKSDKMAFIASIKAIKVKTRAAMAGLTKQRDKIDEAGRSCYSTRPCGAPFAYRVEIVRLCTLERQTLLSSSFTDTYVLGPEVRAQDQGQSWLISEAGRFEPHSFIYVLTWVECVRMMQTAPLQRRSTVLKPMVDFLIARYQLMAIAKFECSMSNSADRVFESLYEHSYTMNTLVFQKLLNELGRLPNGREVDVSASYLQEKVKMAQLRFEYTIIEAMEEFFGSLDGAADQGLTGGDA